MLKRILNAVNITSISLMVILNIALIKQGFGQSAPSFPQVAPVSPSASALQKFTDYPVNLNTGLIDISIPIYRININGIKYR